MLAAFFIVLLGPLFSVSPNAIRLRVGSTRRDSGGRIVRVANVTVHERYGQPRFDNDIAVLRLASPLTFTNAIRAIRLPQPRQAVPLVRLTVTGWGLTAVSYIHSILWMSLQAGQPHHNTSGDLSPYFLIHTLSYHIRFLVKLLFTASSADVVGIIL